MIMFIATIQTIRWGDDKTLREKMADNDNQKK